MPAVGTGWQRHPLGLLIGSLPDHLDPLIGSCFLINKIDLAKYVGVSIEKMRVDTLKQRAGKPFHFTDLKAQNGVAEVVSSLKLIGGL